METSSFFATLSQEGLIGIWDIIMLPKLIGTLNPIENLTNTTITSISLLPGLTNTSGAPPNYVRSHFFLTFLF